MDPQPPPRKLLDRVRDTLRLKHYSYRTEQTYVDWIRRFILFHNKRHPQDMGVPEIEAFLTHLAVQGKVAAPTQNQAFSALLFLYRHVLQIELDQRINALRAKPSTYLPTVLTPTEVRAIFAQLRGECGLLLQLLYGSGLRLREGLNLRIKDLDFSQHQVVIYNRLFAPQISPKKSAATPSATASPPTYYKAATTSAPSKNSLATKTSKPP